MHLVHPEPVTLRSELKKPMDPCKPNPCMNDGVCSLLGGSFRCDCRGFEGPQCETSELRETTHYTKAQDPVAKVGYHNHGCVSLVFPKRCQMYTLMGSDLIVKIQTIRVTRVSEHTTSSCT